MANLKVSHAFVISKGTTRQEAYLLAWKVQYPVHPGMEPDTERQWSAWTTLAAAKKAACDAVGRQRLTWTGPHPGDGSLPVEIWKADCVQVVKP